MSLLDKKTQTNFFLDFKRIIIDYKLHFITISQIYMDHVIIIHND